MFKKIAISILLFIFLAIGFLAGYVLGYVHGGKAIAEYGLSMMDKINIDNFEVSFNTTKLDELTDELRNMSNNIREEIADE